MRYRFRFTMQFDECVTEIDPRAPVRVGELYRPFERLYRAGHIIGTHRRSSHQPIGDRVVGSNTHRLLRFRHSLFVQVGAAVNTCHRQMRSRGLWMQLQVGIQNPLRLFPAAALIGRFRPGKPAQFIVAVECGSVGERALRLCDQAELLPAQPEIVVGFCTAALFDNRFEPRKRCVLECAFGALRRRPEESRRR